MEDDAALVRLLRDNLVCEGFVVEHAGTVDVARRKLATFKPDVVLLDLTLPDEDGLQICRSLKAGTRARSSSCCPRGNSQADKIRGLDLGADDYVTKPFAFGELLARMRAVMRRRGSAPATLKLGDVSVDFQVRRAVRAGRDLNLSLREMEVLRYLAERAGAVVTRDDLLQAVWGYRDPP